MFCFISLFLYLSTLSAAPIEDIFHSFIHNFIHSLIYPVSRFSQFVSFPPMRAFPLLGALASFLLPLLRPVTADDAATSCDCFETSTHDYFTEHIFHDFRALPSASAAPPLPSGLPPTLMPTQANYISQPDIGLQQAGWIQSSAWTNFWGTMSWGKVSTSDFPIRMQNSLANVYVGALYVPEG